ncbi:MAG: hypothetical protein ATN31_02895 [Candidatus Epulonipiscioides saccharophilum]|nr:MAG: hypothetical protein ATN31_02895 [Epulopiscium sp. AS2M-Bin001]
MLKNSFILTHIKNYLHSLMNINSALIGVSFLMISTVTFFKYGLNLYNFLTFITSALLTFANVNIIDLISQSKLCSLLFEMSDLKIVKVHYPITTHYNYIYGIVIGSTCSILILSTNIWIGLLFIFIMTIYSFVIYNPLYGLYLLVLSGPIFNTKLILGLTVLVILSTVIRNLFTKNYKWILDDIGFILIGLLGMYFLSSIFSFKKFESLSIFGVYIIFIGFYIIGIQLITKMDILIRCIKLFVLSGALVSTYGILQYIFDWGVNQNWIDPSVFSITDRAYSTLDNPNLLGVYLIMAIMLGLGIMLSRKRDISRIFYGSIVFVMAICMGATFSRGCWIGLAIALAIFITIYNGNWWALAFIGILLAPFLLPDSIIERLLSIGNMEDTSTAIRVKIWLSSLRMGSDFFLTGAGLGTASFGYLYPFYTYYYIPAQHSHNAFFQIFIESGLIGLILFLFAIWRFEKHLALCFNYNKNNEVRIISLAFMSSIIGFFIQGLFDYPFYNYRIVFLFWLVILLGSSLAKCAQTE